MRRYVLLLLTCGCRQIFGLDTPAPQLGDSGRFDSTYDSPAPDASPLCFARAEVGLAGCLTSAPASDLAIGQSTTFDTDAMVLCAPLASSSQSLCVVAARSIQIETGATIHVTGAKPLVLFAQGSIAIVGTLDVSSHSSFGQPAIGPGENPSACATTADGTSSSGGAGGSFATVGGSGGTGTGGHGGIAGPALPLTAFYGGCRGGLGGSHDANATAAGGGGALALFASTIAIDGTVNASGMAGRGGATGATGGYGGASGGMIVLAAPTITTSATTNLFAIGGGGGGGATSSGGGARGGEATAFDSTVLGGAGDGNAGDGGGASPLAIPGHPTVLIGGGGGGGGGGNGAILLFTDSPPADSKRIFPAPQLSPY